MEEIKSKSVDLGKLQQYAHELMEKISGVVSFHFVLFYTLNLAQCPQKHVSNMFTSFTC